MPSEAVKIVYGTTTLLFSKDEVLDAVWGQAQGYQVHAKQAASPGVNYTGAVVDTLEITFDIQRLTTLNNIDLFLACGLELTVYYSQQFDDTAHLHCVPMRDGMEEIETFGDIEAVTRTIKFIKTAA
jgi:hypothetical protein